jgi:DNA-directed RNA polymerase specialized sigma24 family protein
MTLLRELMITESELVSPPSHTGAAFPPTGWTIVLQAARGDELLAEQAMRQLCAVYCDPVRRWLLRTGRSAQQAEDLTQGFMEHLLEANRLEGFEKRNRKFRSFLLECLKRFMRGLWRKERAEKRGGDVEHVDIDESPVGIAAEMHRGLDLQFAVTMHGQAILALANGRYAAEPKRVRFEALRQFIWSDDGPSYAEVGQVLGMTENHVKKAVFDLRQYYFEAFRQEAAQTVAPELLDEETRYLLTLLAENKDSWTHSPEPLPTA